MATQSLIDFDDDIQQAGVTIDLAIQQQLSELLKVNLSTVGSSNPTQSSSTSTSLLDLNDNDESRVVTAKSSSNPTSKPKTSTCLLDLDDNGELCNAAAEKSQPIQQKNSINSTRPSVQLISNDSSNTLETLSSELKKNAILIPETDPDKPVIVYSNAIGLLFEFAAKQKLKNPCFDQENLGNQFKVKCSFSGVEGEGMGRSLKIAKMQAAQNCLRNFNTARLNKQLDLGEFHKEPDIVTKTNNKNSKPSNAIGELYEHAAKFLNARPEFECREESGLIRTYTVTCSYLTYSETSNNKSKQKAKTEAAAKVYEKLLSTRR